MILSQYASTLGSEAAASEMRLSITVDDRYLVQLLDRRDGRVLVRSRLMSLPPAGVERDTLIEKYARVACGRMLRAPVALSIDARERALWVQQVCVASNAQELDEHVGDFVNELAFWRSTVEV